MSAPIQYEKPLSRYQKLYRSRKFLGLCVDCAKPAYKDHARCQSCSIRRNSYDLHCPRLKKCAAIQQLQMLPSSDPTVEMAQIVVVFGIANRRLVHPGQQIKNGLKLLRDARFEVDLLIRGTWRDQYGLPKYRVFDDVPWEMWRHGKNEIVGGYVELAAGPVIPAPTRKPPPEIVLRGVRRVRD